jgi:hypothetical protein
MPSTPASRFVLLAAAAALTTAIQIPAEAQNRPASPREATVATIELSDEPFRLESVGLTLYLPVGALAQTSRAGENASVQIMPGDANPTWLVNLQTPQSTNIQRTAPDVAEEVLNQLLASVGVIDRQVGRDGTITERLVSTSGTVIEPVRPLELAGVAPEARRPGARFYVRLPRGERETAVVRGYTIFQTGPGRFVTFDLVTTEPDFARSRRAYETVVATSRFEDITAAAAARGEAVQAGTEFFARLSSSDYEAVFARLSDQWFRLARQPAGTSDRDAQEIAYRRVRAWKGFRGEIDPRRGRNSWTSGDRQEGYLLRVDARFLQEGRTIDSIGIYFMSPDRREEAWSLQMAIREPNRRQPATWTETGARSGRSMSITTTGTAQENVAATPHIPDRGYITQLEAFLLPHLMVHAEAAGEYGFYAYQSEQNNVRLRRDTLTRTGNTWTLVSRHNEDREPLESTFNEDGGLVRTQLPDGTLWMPTTLERLADLWRSKGLPME